MINQKLGFKDALIANHLRILFIGASTYSRLIPMF